MFQVSSALIVSLMYSVVLFSDGSIGACSCVYRDGTSIQSNTTDTGWTGERCEIPPEKGTYTCANQICRTRVGKGAEEFRRAMGFIPLRYESRVQVGTRGIMTVLFGQVVRPEVQDHQGLWRPHIS